MRYIILISLGLFFSTLSIAEPINIELAKVNIDIHDKAAIQRGALFFKNVCMACHTLIYLRYDKLADEAGVTYDKMPIHVTSWPNNVKPPDLSLEADVRGVDWIYTYLHSFYLDPSRPTGANNLVRPDTAMPNMVTAFQGVQILATDRKKTSAIESHSLQWYDVLELQKQGSMTPEQFDETMKDVVSFLAYVANPHIETQHRLGWWVLGYLLIMVALTYLLKRSYWRDINKE